MPRPVDPTDYTLEDTFNSVTEEYKNAEKEALRVQIELLTAEQTALRTQEEVIATKINALSILLRG